MGCDDACLYIPGKRYIDWDLEDPRGRPVDEVRATRDDIAARVEALVAELDGGRAYSSRRGYAGTVELMKVEVLYFDGCPNHEALLPHLRELLELSGTATSIELVRVEDAEAAERERFLGSPTVRVDGEDVEPGAAERSDFGFKCRLFATAEGLRGLPADAWVLAALQRAQTS